MDWTDVARMRAKYDGTKECELCNNSGLVLRQYVFSGKQMVQGFPCGVCGQRHGYNEYVRAKYANGVSRACHIADNLYAFPTEKRQENIDREFFANNGVIPTKSPSCDNLLKLSEYLNGST